MREPFDTRSKDSITTSSFHEHVREGRAGRRVGLLMLEGVLLFTVAGLTLFFLWRPGPLPGDIGVEKGFQQAILPHPWLAGPLEAVSTLNWPVPAGISLGVVVVAFLLLRRWLDAIVVLLCAGVADETTYLISQYVRRPRPMGHGIHVLSVIKHTYSFPSGHMVYATAVFGLLLYLTFQIRRRLHPALTWFFRVLLLCLILAMGPSRIIEGEHWPSDVVSSVLWGAFWLLLFAHAYGWARSRFPRLLAADER
ncbi:MAG: phosphatase PAP2 family protein [Chloroflexota bacterium]